MGWQASSYTSDISNHIASPIEETPFNLVFGIEEIILLEISASSLHVENFDEWTIQSGFDQTWICSRKSTSKLGWGW